MSRTPEEVARIVSEDIARQIYEASGDTPQIIARPSEGSILFTDGETRIVHYGIRFCCTYHCMYDVHRDIAEKAAELFDGVIIAIGFIRPPEH